MDSRIGQWYPIAAVVTCFLVTVTLGGNELQWNAPKLSQQSEQANGCPLPNYVFLLENHDLEQKHGLVRNLTAYELRDLDHDNSISPTPVWSIALEKDMVIFNKNNWRKNFEYKYVDLIYLNNLGDVTKIRYNDNFEVGKRDESIEINIGENVPYADLCPPCLPRSCPPCIIRTEYAVSCMWNIRTGYQYSCTGSKTSGSMVKEEDTPYLLRGIQSLVQYDVIRPKTSEIILSITKQIGFHLSGPEMPSKAFNATENVFLLSERTPPTLAIGNMSKVNNPPHILPLPLDFHHAWKIWDHVEMKTTVPQDSVDLVDPNKMPTRDNSETYRAGLHSGMRYAFSRFTKTSLESKMFPTSEFKSISPEPNALTTYQGIDKAITPKEYLKGIISPSDTLLGLSYTLDNLPSVEVTKPPLQLDYQVNVDPSHRNPLVDQLDPTDDLETLFPIYLTVSIFLISLVLWFGHQRHDSYLYYLDLHLLMHVMWEFIVYIKNFNKARKRNISESDHIVVDIDYKTANDASKMIPEEYKDVTRLRSLSESTETELPLTEYPTNKKFDSKYEREFRTISVLGVGGFGVVFEAENLNDKNIYAVKRIELPSDPEKQQKILRESKANFQLSNQDVDKRHFIQYYQAWEERNVPIELVMAHDLLFDKELDSAVTQSHLESTTNEQSHTGDAVADISSGYKSKGHLIPLGHVDSVNGDSLNGLHWDGESDGSWDEDSDTENSTILELTNSESFSCSLPSKIQIHGARLRKNVSMDLRRNFSVQSDSSGISFLAASDDEKDSNFSDSDFSETKETASQSTPKSCWTDRDPNYRHFLYLVLQLCSRKTLKQVLRDREKIDARRSLDIFHQICCGVKVLHDFQMIHRDLKPANILFSMEKGIVKLGDLGLITMKDDTTDMVANVTSKRAANESSVHTSGVGTRLYMAPELRNGQKYSHPVDIFALGIILLELFCKFGTQTERVITILQATHASQQLPNGLITEFQEITDLISKMLQSDPADRPKIEFILDEINKLLKQYEEEEKDI